MTESGSPLDLVTRLAEALDQRHISYCHWKSNAFIARSEAGENDLDLLVARDQANEFREVLAHLGFSRVERQRKPTPPGKEDYFGYDSGTGKLVHVDAHYQLILGHDLTKSHRIPVEGAFLASVERCGLFQVPSPELEYVVFAVRMTLKYAIWDEVVWQWIRGRRAGLKPSERDELKHLETLIDPDRVGEVVREHTPWLGDGLLGSCVAVAHGELSAVGSLRTGRRLRAAMEAHARHRSATATFLRLWRRIALGISKRIGYTQGYRLASGGALVAVVGGDGSGKSTAVAEVGRWLEQKLEVRRLHMGRPPWSATTTAIRGALKLAHLARSTVRRKPADDGSDGDEAVPGLRKAVWLVCTARDRYSAYRKARRFASRGGIVLSDRYPHPVSPTMDAPAILRESGPELGRFANALGRLERRYYDRMDGPDVIAALVVDPDTAAQRKTDEPAEYVRRRVAEVWDVDWEAHGVLTINARQTKEAVAADLKSIIWAALS